MHDIAFALKQELQVCFKKSAQKTIDSHTLLQNENILSINTETYCYQITLGTSKTSPEHGFDLLELLFITENSSFVTVLNAVHPFFGETAFLLQEKKYNNKDKITYSGSPNTNKRILQETEITAIVQYLEQDCTTIERLSPNHVRITTKILILNKELLLQISGKTVFITHKKNNEYFRTGPFLFSQPSEIIDKLLAVEELESIDSSGIGGNMHTIAFIDIYES